jgi:hypothetical protein
MDTANEACFGLIVVFTELNGTLIAQAVLQEDFYVG